MSWGRRNRLSRIVDAASGRTNLLAVDHGYFLGPVVVAGGKKLDSVGQALSLAGAAVRPGAAGIDFGRNVWQSDHPVATIRSLRAVVHDGLGDREALDLYERL